VSLEGKIWWLLRGKVWCISKRKIWCISKRKIWCISVGKARVISKRRRGAFRLVLKVVDRALRPGIHCAV
jgi:hypothetical protein